MKKDISKLKRPRYPMPGYILQALKKHGVLLAYKKRPPYQQNDYIGWIDRAVQDETKQKRLAQMLDELKRGNVYMNMSYEPGKKMTVIGKSAAAKDVDDYLKGVPTDTRAVLEDLRREIKSADSDIEETIYYRVPTYKYHRQPLLMFVAHKDHCSLTIMHKEILEKFKKELQDFEVSGTTIHFSAEHPLSETLIKKIVKERIKEEKAVNKK